MKVYLFIFSFISVTCLGQGAMLGTDDDLLVAEGSTFKVISSIGEIPFDYVEGETFGVFVSRYNFNIGRMSTSIEFVSPEIAELKVYPNPFVEKVHIQVEGLTNEPVRIMLVNLEGKLEYQHEISDAGDLLEHSINMEHLASGQYFIIMQQENRMIGNATVIKAE